MTTMSIATFKKVAQKLPASTSILLRADHGKGKSQVVRQLAAPLALRFGFEVEDYEVIDRRLSQMTEGDMVGLPSTDGECTRFNPPDWYKAACDRPCILFLDELNRATPEVMQAAFQIVLDRELNGWKLHKATMVFAAINTGATYTVNQMDPALLDRFFVTDLVPTIEDWLSWAKTPNADKAAGFNVHPVVSDFIHGNNKWLDPPKNSTDALVVHPSRRSWERVSDTLCEAELIEDASNELFYNLCLGYVGTEASIAFSGFAKNYNHRLTAEDILERYHTKAVKAKVAKQGTERLNVCIDKVTEYITEKLTELTERQGKNLNAFMGDLTDELRIACWSKLTVDGADKMDLAASVHKYCARQILDVFNVPFGEAGIGVVPTIPGLFPEADKAAEEKAKKAKKSKKK